MEILTQKEKLKQEQFKSDKNLDLFTRYIFNRNNLSIIDICKFLEYTDLISLRQSSKTLKNLINKKFVKKYVRLGGISNKTRKNFWKYNLDCSDIEQQINKEHSGLHHHSGSLYNRLYQNFMQGVEISQIEDNKHCPNRRAHEDILKDINRTFHNEKFSSEEGQKQLQRVLSCLAYVRPEISYCQGMNFVAGGILQFIDEEELSFWIFLHLIDNYDVNSLYLRV